MSTRPRRWFLSPITLRILAINALALAILGGGLLYLDQFRGKLAASRLAELRTQSRIIAGALGEAATLMDEEGDLDIPQARRVLRRLVGESTLRARVFDAKGELVADSRFMFLGSSVIATELPPLDANQALLQRWADGIQQWVASLIRPSDLPLYTERAIQKAQDYPEVLSALRGETAARIRSGGKQIEVLSVAAPVQRLRRVLGAILVTTDTADIEALVRDEQISILKVFGFALAITLVLSLFLAQTIALPLRKLARAATKLEQAPERQVKLPDYSSRRDEIGDLSRALTSMTSALYRQLAAVESFAADVAHEIKNPLSSLRSAAETLARSKDPDAQRMLLPLLIEDVRRLDRLITDISSASRLDAELSRAQMAPVDLTALLTAICQIYAAGQDGDRETGPPVTCTCTPDVVYVSGIETRLAQVVRNLLENARSF
ncbi:MAG: stimulus-sensing domain-containing protein, partial [Pseudomonadota bacterium]